MEGCIFCRIAKGEIPCNKIYEDNDVIAFLDINPINEGHTLVVPKKHCDKFSETDDEELGILIKAVKKIANTIKKAISADGYNIGVNNERLAGQLVYHVHVHIIPRFSGDGLEHWKGKKVSSAELKQTSEEIRKAF
ncbi:MAG TPA: HIT family protein [Candidatus Nanoarchaeia archaeon]|nr:HIT family protein [Candidatus Nanoarchaeia archaeon]